MKGAWIEWMEVQCPIEGPRKWAGKGTKVLCREWKSVLTKASLPMGSEKLPKLRGLVKYCARTSKVSAPALMLRAVMHSSAWGSLTWQHRRWGDNAGGFYTLLVTQVLEVKAVNQLKRTENLLQWTDHSQNIYYRSQFGCMRKTQHLSLFMCFDRGHGGCIRPWEHSGKRRGSWELRLLII